MKQSQYNSYDDLPLFLNAEAGAPGKTQHSGFAGERRSGRARSLRCSSSPHTNALRLRGDPFGFPGAECRQQDGGSQGSVHPVGHQAHGRRYPRMTALTYQKDARAYRFSLPNEIWG